MAFVTTRELLPFPIGDNSSDTLINNVHWNLTTLRHWNYTYYSNGTFSNGSRCFLLFEPYTPCLLPNGTFLNSTSCYSPIRPMGPRSKIGLFFASFLALSIIFTSINLSNHAKQSLPQEKSFSATGRRWPWYWLLILAMCGAISGFTGLDIDRYYLPEFPVVLSNFFWFLMLPAAMCAIWENVRNFGCCQQRRKNDLDSIRYEQNGQRERLQFYLPFVFYLSVVMNLLMTLPHPWGVFQLQRDADQARLQAAPVATDIRFKLGGLFLLLGWFVVVVSLHNSIQRYKLPASDLTRSNFGYLKAVYLKYVLALLLSLVMISYEAACAFDFSLSPLNVKANVAWIYGLGWAPIALIICTFEIAGYYEPNEDTELIRQRRCRDEQERETRALHDEQQRSSSGQMGMQVDGDMGSPEHASRVVESDRSIELTSTAFPEREEYAVNSSQTPQPVASSFLGPHHANGRTVESPRGLRDRSSGSGDTLVGAIPLGSDRQNHRRSSVASSATAVQTQHIRSMLDV